MDTFNNTYNPEVEDYEDTTPFFTMDEATTLLSTEDARLARAQQRLRDAQAFFDEHVTNNPRVEGPEGDRIRKELTDEYLPLLMEAEREVEGLAEVIHMNAGAVYAQTREAQYDFSVPEYQMIDARRETIKEDAANLSYARLANAVQYAILQNDRAAMYLYSRYVPERLTHGEANRTWEDTAARQEKSQLQRALRTIDAKLKNDKLAKLNGSAADLLRQAGTLHRKASRRRIYSQKYSFEGDHDVPWDGE